MTMLKVADLLAQLDESDRLALANALGAGLHDARMAAQCITSPDSHSEHVVQLLAYLTRAIGALNVARDLVRRNS
jgi:hypothetical protein